MPIPFLLIAGIGAAAAVGIGKTGKAIYDQYDAKQTNELAKWNIENAKELAENARKKCGLAIENLGRAKIDVLDSNMTDFIASFEKLQNVELEDSIGMDELKSFRIDKNSLAELKTLQNAAVSIAASMGSGAVAGVLTAFGAYSAAGMFASASTGTAIATLHGVAATNATLAFFGGGSLAAGGLGIAGGTMVLGGLVAAPALLIMGFVMGAKASKARDDAYSNYEKSIEFEEEMKKVVTLSNGIRLRANMLERLLLKLDSIFEPLVYELGRIVKTTGTDYSQFSIEQKSTVAASMSMAGAIKAVLDTPLLTEDGKLTEQSGEISTTIQPVFEAYEKQ